MEDQQTVLNLESQFSWDSLADMVDCYDYLTRRCERCDPKNIGKRMAIVLTQFQVSKRIGQLSKTVLLTSDR